MDTYSHHQKIALLLKDYPNKYLFVLKPSPGVIHIQLISLSAAAALKLLSWSKRRVLGRKLPAALLANSGP